MTEKTHVRSLIKKAGDEHLKLFIQTVRQCLFQAGRDKTELDEILKKSFNIVRMKGVFEVNCTQLLELFCKDTPSKEQRELDCIGRILVEYCFIRTPERTILYPEDSPQDDKARKEFVENVIPRPLMHYFLVSVRGSIPQLDGFKAESILFGAENAIHEAQLRQAKEISEEYRDKAASGMNINWDAVYADIRFQRIILKLVGEIRRKIEELGNDRYLRVLENYKQRDQNSKGLNTMHRPFVAADVQLLEEALWNAEKMLAQLT